MSYDVYVINENGDPLYSETPIEAIGGTYALGGTDELWLNITYNYSKILHEVFEIVTGLRAGLDVLERMNVKQSIPILQECIALLRTDVDDADYWKATEGNVRKALEGLLELVTKSPEHGIWHIS